MPPVVPQSVSSSFFLSFFFCFCRTVDSAKPRFFASVTTDPRTPRRTFAQRRAHDTLLMSSHAAHTAMTGVTGGITTVTTPASLADTQEAIPRLPDPLVVTHILRSEYFDDPADLARLPAVSRAMRDAVAATGLRFKELDEKRAVDLGCVSAVNCLYRGGRLSHRVYLCEAEARGGHLEELKDFRANDTPWDESTCWAAAMGPSRHLEVMKWARERSRA